MNIEKICAHCRQTSAVPLTVEECPICGESYFTEPEASPVPPFEPAMAPTAAPSSISMEPAPEPKAAVEEPVAQFGFGPEYDRDQSAFVLKRLAAMAEATRQRYAWSYGFRYGVFGAIVGFGVDFMMTRQGTGGIGLVLVVGLIVGAVVGVQIGLNEANFRVVWIEWGAQVLSSLDHLTLKSNSRNDRIAGAIRPQRKG